MLLADLRQSQLELLVTVISTKNFNGRVDHLKQERRMHQETTAADQLVDIRVHLDTEAKELLRFRANLEETEAASK